MKNINLNFYSKLKALILKELKSFFREPIQWLQIVIVLALTFVYILNILKLPLNSNYLRLSVSILNIFGIIFITTALVLRFIFIQPSLEYKYFWILKSSPLNIKKVFFIKFLIYLPLIILCSTILTIISSYILKVNNNMFFISLFVTFISSVIISILGYSLGILYPKKDYKDIAEIEISFGGLIFIIFSLFYIVVLFLNFLYLIKKYIFSQNILIIELLLSLILYFLINFIFSFIPFLYAYKKFFKYY